MASEPKKLYRSKDDRWLAGVCGGLAKYFNVDATLVRVLFFLFAWAVGGGILIYIILWIFIPEEPEGGMEKVPEAEVSEMAEEEPEAEEPAPAEETPAAEGDESA